MIFAHFYQDLLNSDIDFLIEKLVPILYKWQFENKKTVKFLHKLKQKVKTEADTKLFQENGLIIIESKKISQGFLLANKNILKELKPWRKGPFKVFNIHIDSMWQSNLKWQRFANKIQTLKGKNVLDVGSNNGYFLMQSYLAGAKFSLGIDPSKHAFCQFEVLKKLANNPKKINLLPLKCEEFPSLGIFDTVFSLGVIYHRKSPIEHLEELRSFLKPKGELVLETLISTKGDLIFPSKTYAKMRNVFFIPSLKILFTWLERLKFEVIKVISISKTTPSEQKTTTWCDAQGLDDFLDPTNPNYTIEGYFAPVRAIISARIK